MIAAAGARTGQSSRSKSGANRSGRVADDSRWPWPGTSPSASRPRRRGRERAAVPHLYRGAAAHGLDGQVGRSATDYYNARTTEYTGLEPRNNSRAGAGERPSTRRSGPGASTLGSARSCLASPTRSSSGCRRWASVFRWHLTEALALRDDSGRITKWFGSCIDIDDSERRAQESAPRGWRRRRRRPTGPRTSSWPTSVMRSAPR